MTQLIDIEAIKKLSVAERLAIIAQIWDTLTDDEIPVPDRVIEEMERRAAELDANPSSAVSYEEMKQRLQEMKWPAQ